MLLNNPLISLILCSRNDSYMGNSRWRLETSINLALLNAKDAKFLDKLEIVVSDWGSEVPLFEVLNLVPEAKDRVKFVHVPPYIAAVEQKDSKFPEVLLLMQLLADQVENTLEELITTPSSEPIFSATSSNYTKTIQRMNWTWLIPFFLWRGKAFPIVSVGFHCRDH